MPGSVNANLAQDIIDAFRQALDPLIDILGDPAARDAVLQDLGLNPNGSGPPQLDPAVRDRVAQYVDSVDQDLQAFDGVARDITRLLAAVRGVIEASDTGGSAVVDELLHHVLGLAGTSFIRYRLPRLYWFARLLGLIEEKITTEATGSSGPFNNLVVEGLPNAIPAFCDLYNSLADENDAQLVSRSSLDIVGIIGAVMKRQVMVGWEPSPGSTTPVADRIADRALSIRFNGQGTDAGGNTIDASATLTVLFVPETHHGPGIFLSVAGDTRMDIPLETLRDDVAQRVRTLRQQRQAGHLSEDEFERARRAITADWVLSFSGGSNNGVDLFIPFDDTFPEDIRIGGGSEVHLEISLKRQRDAPDSPYLFGSANGTRLELGEVSLRAFLEAAKQGETSRLDAGFEALAAKGALVVRAGEGDGFIRRILKDSDLRLDFALGLGYSLARSWYLKGGTGLELTLPINRHLLGFDIDHLTLGLAPSATNEPPGVALAVGLGLRLRLASAFTAFVDQLGFRLLFRQVPNGDGNLGPLDVAFGYKPPTQLGIAIDTSVVTGGGYLIFEPEKHRYSGALVVEIGKVTVNAVGLLTTRLPDGREGFSLLISLSASGFTPIQLGLGFTLIGMGGLLGLHRRADADVLRAGLKNKTLDAVLFPEDPLARLPQLVTVLERVFPVSEGRYLVGPAAVIGWGTPPRLTLELALILELPAPVRLLILGQLRAFLPMESAPILRLKMDALGVVDFEQGEVSLDATLYESRLMDFGLSGDMALRARWESDPGFVLAVGGLNPRFNPPAALDFPKLKRITIDFTRRDNPRLRLSAYLALTSNTLQIGARAELYVGISALSVQGAVGFDVLIRFSPFGFVADVSGEVAVKWGSHTLLGIYLEASLSGPDPLVIRGKGKVKIWIFSKSFDFDHTLSDAETPPPLPAANPLPDLVAALQDARSWSAQLPSGGHMLVALRQIPVEPGVVLAHPLGTLTVTQTVVPLNLNLDRYNGATLAGERRFSISHVSLGNDENPPVSPVRDWFAPGEYFDLTDAERLSRPSFERMDAGLHIGADEVAYGGDRAGQAALMTTAAITYETKVIGPDGQEVVPGPSYTPDPVKFTAAVTLGAVARKGMAHTGRARYYGPRGGVEIVEPGYAVASAETLRPAADTLASFSAALEALATLQTVATQAGEAGEAEAALQVVGEHVLKGALT
jgi:hypothetical protein